MFQAIRKVAAMRRAIKRTAVLLTQWTNSQGVVGANRECSTSRTEPWTGPSLFSPCDPCDLLFKTCLRVLLWKAAPGRERTGRPDNEIPAGRK
jgi:hypothetical protein